MKPAMKLRVLWKIAVLLCPGLLAVQPALAGGDAAAGKPKAEICAACHGADGNSENPIYPRLAGQYADYLEKALHEYKSGARANPIMQGFAAALSDQDIADLAAYFSTQEGRLSAIKME